MCLMLAVGFISEFSLLFQYKPSQLSVLRALQWQWWKSNPRPYSREDKIQHEVLRVSMPSSSSSVVMAAALAAAVGRSYDLSMAARKLSLQPRPLMMRGRGLWKGWSPPFRVTSATAVWRLSRELDFFRPRDGPTSRGDDPGRLRRGRRSDTTAQLALSETFSGFS